MSSNNTNDVMNPIITSANTNSKEVQTTTNAIKFDQFPEGTNPKVTVDVYYNPETKTLDANITSKPDEINEFKNYMNSTKGGKSKKSIKSKKSKGGKSKKARKSLRKK